jgi:hypothetical protein
MVDLPEGHWSDAHKAMWAKLTDHQKETWLAARARREYKQLYLENPREFERLYEPQVARNRLMREDPTEYARRYLLSAQQAAPVAPAAKPPEQDKRKLWRKAVSNKPSE